MSRPCGHAAACSMRGLNCVGGWMTGAPDPASTLASGAGSANTLASGAGSANTLASGISAPLQPASQRTRAGRARGRRTCRRCARRSRRRRRRCRARACSRASSSWRCSRPRTPTAAWPARCARSRPAPRSARTTSSATWSPWSSAPAPASQGPQMLRTGQASVATLVGQTFTLEPAWISAGAAGQLGS